MFSVFSPLVLHQPMRRSRTTRVRNEKPSSTRTRSRTPAVGAARDHINHHVLIVKHLEWLEEGGGVQIPLITTNMGIRLKP